MTIAAIDLTATRIRRAARRTLGPAIDEEIAREDAAVVHDIIACVRRAYAIQSTDWCGDESDTIETILRTVAGVSPEDYDDACNEGEWMMWQLTRTEQLTGERDIYRRWLRVVGHVENFDYEDFFTEPEQTIDDDLLRPEFTSEDEDEDDDQDRRPHLHLVTDPDDMTRRFLALMGDDAP